MKQKTIEFFPKFALSKEILSIWARRADSEQNWNNLFSIREICQRYQNILVSFPKQYRNVCPFVFDITTQDNATRCLGYCGERGSGYERDAPVHNKYITYSLHSVSSCHTHPGTHRVASAGCRTLRGVGNGEETDGHKVLLYCTPVQSWNF